MTAPTLVPCPQCGSLYCGPVRCRFHGTDHPKLDQNTAAVEQCLYYRRPCDCGLNGYCIEAA